MSNAAPGAGRWSGRNADKDVLRGDVWRGLEASGVNVGPAWSRIPNFSGADLAALNLTRVPAWATARIVKTNPDPPQIPVRLRALYDGKIVYAPVPELTKGFPFIRHGSLRRLPLSSGGFHRNQAHWHNLILAIPDRSATIH